MNKKIVYLSCLLLCACASDQGDHMANNIDDGELPALRLAERLRQEGNHSSALNFYEKAMKSEPDNNDIKLSYAMSLRGSGSYGDARRVLLDLNKNEPGNKAVRIELARTFIEENKPQEALNYLAPLIKPDMSTDVAMLEAVSLDLLKQHGKAQDVYRDILVKQPHNLRVQSNLGLSLAISGKPEEAITILEDVHKSNRATIRDRHNLAIAYEKAGQRDKATKLWKMDLTAQEAEETQQFFDSINGQTTIDTAAFDRATNPTKIQEVALDSTNTSYEPGSETLAKYTQVNKPVPAPKNVKGTTAKVETPKAKETPKVAVIKDEKMESTGEPLTHLNGPIMDENF